MVGLIARRGVGRVPDWPRTRAVVLAAWPAAAVLLFQVVCFPIPFEVSLQGVVLGLLNAVIVQGLILVYRANRVVNFAQASIGTFPSTVAGAVVLFGAPSAMATGSLAIVGGLVVLLGALTVARLGPVASVAAALLTSAFCAVGLQ